MLEENFSEHTEKDSHGVALKAAKDKWNELGPLKLEDIVANSNEPIDQTMSFGQAHLETFFSGHFSPQIAQKRLSPQPSPCRLVGTYWPHAG